MQATRLALIAEQIMIIIIRTFIRPVCATLKRLMIIYFHLFRDVLDHVHIESI